MGFLQQVEEEVRALNAAGFTGRLGPDNRYWKSGAYAFSITTPGSPNAFAVSPPGVSGSGRKYFFPLVINPRVYAKSMPFTMDVTPTQEGGVYIEESGIILSEITLEGHTALTPRINAGEVGQTRPTLPLSGQAHFIRLQDECFDFFSELKKDHEVGPRTTMRFHNFKDNEHFIVSPMEFSLHRDAGGAGRTMYPYRIRLKVLGKVEATSRGVSEDSAVIRALANASKALNKASAELRAGVSDVAGILDVIEAHVPNIADLTSTITAVSGAVNDFTTGVTQIVALPYNTITSLNLALDGVVTAVEGAANLPADVVQIYRNTQDALDALQAYPERFKESWDQGAQRFLDLTQGPSSSPDAEINAAAESSVTQASQFSSTGPRPGDKERINGGAFITNRKFDRYEGFRELVVHFNDTLPKIAARELGDARKWLDIALANELSAPYISEEGLPDTIRPGDTIKIPTRVRGDNSNQIKSKGDSELTASQLEVVLGRDLALERSGQQYDLAVDKAHGSADFKTVAGLPNMEQAVTFHLSVERGEDVLYQNVGLPRLIGAKGTLDRVIEAQFDMTETLLQDPRILSVKSADFELVGDTMNVEVTPILTTRTQARVIGRILS